MHVKVVKVTDKGQISLPISIQKEAGIKKGDHLVLVAKGSRVLVQKVKEEDFNELLHASESVAKKLWSSPADDHWDKA